MLTRDHALLIAELARGGLQAASAKTPPAAMRTAWDAMDAFEAWIVEQIRAAQAPAVENPEGPQG